MNQVGQQSIITLCCRHLLPAAQPRQQPFPISPTVWMTDQACDCRASSQLFAANVCGSGGGGGLRYIWSSPGLLALVGWRSVVNVAVSV